MRLERELLPETPAQLLLLQSLDRRALAPAQDQSVRGEARRLAHPLEQRLERAEKAAIPVEQALLFPQLHLTITQALQPPTHRPHRPHPAGEILARRLRRCPARARAVQFQPQGGRHRGQVLQRPP